MSKNEAPQWAVKRACDLVATAMMAQNKPKLHYTSAVDEAVEVFAAYIAQHEEPPADPLLEEARAIVAQHHGIASGTKGHRVESIIEGNGDGYWEMRVVLAALRRGQELAG